MEAPESRSTSERVSSDVWHESLTRTRARDQKELGGLLQSANDYLRSVAVRRIEDDVRTKLSVSDVVGTSS
jgi:hypothetical protein